MNPASERARGGTEGGGAEEATLSLFHGHGSGPGADCPGGVELEDWEHMGDGMEGGGCAEK